MFGKMTERNIGGVGSGLFLIVRDNLFCKNWVSLMRCKLFLLCVYALIALYRNKIFLGCLFLVLCVHGEILCHLKWFHRQHSYQLWLYFWGVSFSLKWEKSTKNHETAKFPHHRTIPVGYRPPKQERCFLKHKLPPLRWRLKTLTLIFYAENQSSELSHDADVYQQIQSIIIISFALSRIEAVEVYKLEIFKQYLHQHFSTKYVAT